MTPLIPSLLFCFHVSSLASQQQQPQRPQQIGVRPFAPPPPGMYGQNQGPPRGPPPPQTPPPPPQYNQYQAPPPPQSQSQYGGQGQGQKPPPPPSYPSPPNPFGSIDREPEAGYGQLPSYPFDEPQIIDGPGMTGPLPPPGTVQAYRTAQHLHSPLCAVVLASQYQRMDHPPIPFSSISLVIVKRLYAMLLQCIL